MAGVADGYTPSRPESMCQKTDVEQAGSTHSTGMDSCSKSAFISLQNVSFIISASTSGNFRG